MKLITNLIVILIITFLTSLVPSFVLSQEKPPTFEVYFSPHGGCLDAIIKELNKAKSTVLVQAYSFTSVSIAKTLLNANKRGIKVEVVLDKSQIKEKYSSVDFLVNSDIPIKIDVQHAKAHNKVMVIDGETVITGSYNFIKAAEEENAENLLIIHDKKLAERYTKNWQEHHRHSEVYTGKRR